MDMELPDESSEHMEPMTPQPGHQPHRRARRIIASVIGLIAICVSFAAGAAYGRGGYVFIPSQFKIVNQKTAVGSADYTLLWDTIQTLEANYINQPINQQNVLYGAVSGAVASLGDPYTEFFDPSELNDFNTQLSGSFAGIGAEVGEVNGNITIIAPIAGDPAQKAGLLPNDVI